MSTIIRSVEEDSAFLHMPLIAASDDVTTAKLMDVSDVLTLASRSILFREGNVAEHLFCVLNGYIRLYRLSRDDREADVRICGPGDTFNECLIFGADHYHYNAQAAESCTLARFELSHLRTMIEEDTQVAKAILKSLSRSLLSTMDSMANDRLQTAPQRVANYLIAQSPSGATSYSLRLPFQKSVLAGKLGLAPEALSRVFSGLREAGVIVRGRIVQINDIGALRQI